MRSLLADADETVQANAAVAIGSVGDASDETIAALVRGLKCSQIDWGYGFPVFLSTMHKLMQANPALLPTLKFQLSDAIRNEANEKVREKLHRADSRISGWAEEKNPSERTSYETPCDQLSFALSNSNIGLSLEIERPNREKLLVRWSGDTHDKKVSIEWNYRDLSFYLYDFERGRPHYAGFERGPPHYAKAPSVRDAVTATRLFFVY